MLLLQYLQANFDGGALFTSANAVTAALGIGELWLGEKKKSKDN